MAPLLLVRLTETQTLPRPTRRESIYEICRESDHRLWKFDPS